MGEVIEGDQRSRVVLAQGVAQGVGLASPGPDEALVGPGEHLDRAEQLAVGGHHSVVVPVGAHEIGEHAGITAVGLRPARRMTIAIARRRERIDRVDRVAGRDQRAHEQAPIGLDADDHLGGRLGMLRQQGMQPGHAIEPLGYPARGQHPALGVEHAHVVVRLGPVDSNEDRSIRPSCLAR